MPAYMLAAFLVLATAIDARPASIPMLIQGVQRVANNRPLTLQSIPTNRTFTFAGCVPPDCQCDVCGMVAKLDSFAPVETRAYEHLGLRGCSTDVRKPGLVVDVGANSGYFTAHALSMGCRVLALEPNPHVATLLQLNIALNRLKVRSWSSTTKHHLLSRDTPSFCQWPWVPATQLQRHPATMANGVRRSTRYGCKVKGARCGHVHRLRMLHQTAMMASKWCLLASWCPRISALCCSRLVRAAL